MRYISKAFYYTTDIFLAVFLSIGEENVPAFESDITIREY